MLRNNLLAYPAGVQPGFDPNHPAARGMSSGNGVSLICQNGSAVNLLNGNRATIGGGVPGEAINGVIGPATTFGSAAADGLEFTSQALTNSGKGTWGAIVQLAGVVSGQYQCIIGNLGSGMLLLDRTSHNLEVYVGAAYTNTSTLALGLNVPYFIAASYFNSSSMMFLLLNLSNGNLQTQNASGITAPSASTGTVTIGNNNFIGQSFDGQIAAAMFSPQSTPLPELLQWAQDPWLFWYPKERDSAPWAALASRTGSS